MKFSLSTNWCNRNASDGEAIARKAAMLGFDELELGFRTVYEQVQGFRRMADSIPPASIHAFCPVPVSAPEGHPELYSLASEDPDARGIARVHVLKNIEFAASIGAKTVVLHAGRVGFGSFFRRSFDSHALHEALSAAGFDRSSRKYVSLVESAKKRRRERGAKVLECFWAEIDALLPALEKHGVVLAFENLPYLEGFPDEREMDAILRKYPSSNVKAWFDTGHHRVREMHGWLDAEDLSALDNIFSGGVAGMHLNDVVDYFDDHFAPGGGKVDFAALESLARKVRHIVFEPKSHVSEKALAQSVEYMRKLWKD